MAEVALEKVSKKWDEVTAVNEVSLTVSAGEFLVLVGPSGCGKSTCLRMIAGLETASSGEIRIAGARVNEAPPKDRDIGMVFQSYALYPHMTVGQNLAFGLKLRRAKADLIKERVTEAAAMLGLESLLDRKPKALSGGQRQRVAIGRAIARQPKVFLFDEPLSNLDAAMRVAMRTELADLHARLGATMIYVTHDQVEAMTLADRIAVLSEGVLQQVGSPLELSETPANRFVAGFIGSPAMNFFDAKRDGEALAILGETVALENIPDHAELTVGIRPQGMVLGEGPLLGSVTLVELLGWEAFVHLECNGQNIVVHTGGTEANDITVGDNVRFGVTPNAAHFFDADGLRI